MRESASGNNKKNLEMMQGSRAERRAGLVSGIFYSGGGQSARPRNRKNHRRASTPVVRRSALPCPVHCIFCKYAV